jgi:hypothetical protein
MAQKVIFIIGSILTFAGRGIFDPLTQSIDLAELHQLFLTQANRRASSCERGVRADAGADGMLTYPQC